MSFFLFLVKTGITCANFLWCAASKEIEHLSLNLGVSEQLWPSMKYVNVNTFNFIHVLAFCIYQVKYVSFYSINLLLFILKIALEKNCLRDMLTCS